MYLFKQGALSLPIPTSGPTKGRAFLFVKSFRLLYPNDYPETGIKWVKTGGLFLVKIAQYLESGWVGTGIEYRGTGLIVASAYTLELI